MAIMSIVLIDIMLDPLQADVLIIGGGFSGTIVAAQLLRRNHHLSVMVSDASGQPGRGLAYKSPHRFHLLNVPAGKLSALPDDPENFLLWAQRNYDASVQARSFLPRSLYGSYVGELLEQSLRGGDQFLWIRDEALSLQPRNGYL